LNKVKAVLVIGYKILKAQIPTLNDITPWSNKSKSK